MPQATARIAGQKAFEDPGTAELTPPALQRAIGEARISFKKRGERSALADLYQAGSCKVRLPRSVNAEPEAVLINTSGGLTDGDRFSVDASWQASSKATITTQACERIYRAREGSAEVVNALHIADGATAHWLPQETILFDGGRLKRHATVRLEGSARFLGIEAVILGRPAMGETVRSGYLSDNWRIEQDGELRFVDRFAVAGDIAAKFDRPGCGAGARAFATLLYADPESAEICEILRSLRPTSAAAFGCTDLDGIVLARFLAPNGQALRAALRPVLEKFRGGEGLPRVWMM
ncbi:urease accessory protein UreD [Rhizobiales bacterium]|uniref:urease accessory protein UreD n=1 Tax=Hongsoonwoonella zoysiae TaxID=2821844 RepID=UPI001561665E|nr:urease accessory protein UreD [Hongsoonwoonella zoysiae]NRG19481.1 urease accessory protein UreD [Hongsoonwoonella zoysiae]